MLRRAIDYLHLPEQVESGRHDQTPVDSNKLTAGYADHFDDRFVQLI